MYLPVNLPWKAIVRTFDPWTYFGQHIIGCNSKCITATHVPIYLPTYISVVSQNKEGGYSRCTGDIIDRINDCTRPSIDFAALTAMSIVINKITSQ